MPTCFNSRASSPLARVLASPLSVSISPPEPPGEPAVSLSPRGTTAAQNAGGNGLGLLEPSWTGQHLHSVAEFPAKGRLGWAEAKRAIPFPEVLGYWGFRVENGEVKSLSDQGSLGTWRSPGPAELDPGTPPRAPIHTRRPSLSSPCKGILQRCTPNSYQEVMGNWGRQGLQVLCQAHCSRSLPSPDGPSHGRSSPGSHDPTGVVEMGFHTSSAGDQRGHHTWTDRSESVLL